MSDETPTWRTVLVPVARLREPSGANPNVMAPEDLERLAANMRERGCLQPVLARGTMPPPLPIDPMKPTRAELTAEAHWLLLDDPLEVIDGSHRVEAAGMAGLTHIPVMVIEASDEQASALRVGMNKIRGELDLSTVGKMLLDLEDSGTDLADVALCGFSSDEIADLIAAVRPVDDEEASMAALGGADPSPEVPDDPDKRYSLEVFFKVKGDRDRAKRALKGRGGDSLADGLLAILNEVGDSSE